MRFVIIASPRTGSNNLVFKLRAHPAILCNGEVFHPKNVWVFWPKGELTDPVKAELLQLKRADPRGLLERVFAANFGRSVVGFKIFRGQNDEIMERLIDDSSIRKIVLYRKNVLANYSSTLAANRTKTFSIRDVGEPMGSPKVPFAPKRFVNFHNSYMEFYHYVLNRLNAKREQFYFLNYEDINDGHLFANLLNFLGVDPEVFSTEPELKPFVKQNPADILSRFANPDDAAGFLHRHGLLHWAHEGETAIATLALAVSPAPGSAWG